MGGGCHHRLPKRKPIDTDIQKTTNGDAEYEDYYVRVNTYIGIVNIHGTNLRLEKMTEDNIKIIGKIESIEIERTIDS